MDARIEELVRKAKGGSRSAFDRLAGIYGERLERFIRSRLGHDLRGRIEAEDVLQDTLLRTFCSIGRLEWIDEEAFFSWLGSVAEHVIKGAAERKNRTAPLPPRFDVPGSHAPRSKALDIDPKYSDAHNALGAVLIDQGKLDEALAAFRRAGDLDPKSGLPHRNLGVALRGQGRLDEATSEFRRALELDPKMAMARCYLLHHIEGLPLEEIGSRLARTEVAVAGLLHRGLKKLREKLGNPDALG